MKTTLIALVIAAAGFTTSAMAASPYQVTGPVLEVTDSKIVIQKGKEKWDIARTADSKITGDLKVGSKVTIQYTMTATTVDVKPEKAPKTAKPTKPATAAEPAAPATPTAPKAP